MKGYSSAVNASGHPRLDAAPLWSRAADGVRRAADRSQHHRDAKDPHGCRRPYPPADWGSQSGTHHLAPDTFDSVSFAPRI